MNLDIQVTGHLKVGIMLYPTKCEYCKKEIKEGAMRAQSSAGKYLYNFHLDCFRRAIDEAGDEVMRQIRMCGEAVTGCSEE